jgi:hypothetical protein
MRGQIDLLLEVPHVVDPDVMTQQRDRDDQWDEPEAIVLD